MLALAGKPMYFLELAIGQFAGVGPLALWNCCPIAQGQYTHFRNFVFSFSATSEAGLKFSFPTQKIHVTGLKKDLL